MLRETRLSRMLTMASRFSASIHPLKLSPTICPRVQHLHRISAQYHDTIYVRCLRHNAKASSHVKHVTSAVHIVKHLE